jgi:hypothetical protein
MIRGKGATLRANAAAMDMRRAKRLNQAVREGVAAGREFEYPSVLKDIPLDEAKRRLEKLEVNALRLDAFDEARLMQLRAHCRRAA